MGNQKNNGWKTKLIDAVRKGVGWAKGHLPWGFRTVAGLLLICGGFLGFLPILGFWMIPLGGALVALDIPPLRRRLERRLEVNPVRKR